MLFASLLLNNGPRRCSLSKEQNDGAGQLFANWQKKRAKLFEVWTVISKEERRDQLNFAEPLLRPRLTNPLDLENASIFV
ncbi:hypothetical protein BESB_003490 [Besnoitia besnoiti]|uniref:Uncharacterized protein n=1 Tax=Besnoitia besnoiti TaxID=94643 RepID=A0A2A9MHI9_BESBE|nr:hypothetical protein BESB_003490 [Besnoitia besnoiti]PFH38008.1 hypothetical protein BESB_003490 [Besnoitia besnoiti]